eukprot:jgi/Tetstr1/466276/TSEL_000956.t1
MGDASPAQLEFMDGELARFLAVGAWERGYCAKWVSRLFLVPRPGTNKWRLIIDLRPLNRYCETRDLSFETLSHLRNLSRPGDYMLQMDLQDGFYAVGIAPEDRDFFTVDYRGTLYRLAGLPMGWSLSPYYFCQFTNVLTRALRRNPAEADGTPNFRRRFGLRMLPYMDDFLFLARTQAEAIWQRDYIERHLSGFGLLRNPNKGVWEPTQKLVHLGLEIDTSGSPTLRAPAEKLASIARAAKRLIQRAKRDRRWLPARELAALAGKCQFLYLAIAPARFYLRELHDVLKTRDSWSGRVKLTRQLERDLQWWVGVPTQHNGRPINRPVETGYLHVDSSSYGWGAVLNEHHEARGFWYDDDRNAHITLKELKAVRLAIESFLPMLQNRHIRLHEDNQALVGVLTNLTSRSPRLMPELRKTWYLMDTHGITLSVRYIRSAANIWADRLSRESADPGPGVRRRTGDGRTTASGVRSLLSADKVSTTAILLISAAGMEGAADVGEGTQLLPPPQGAAPAPGEGGTPPGAPRAARTVSEGLTALAARGITVVFAGTDSISRRLSGGTSAPRPPEPPPPAQEAGGGSSAGLSRPQRDRRQCSRKSAVDHLAAPTKLRAEATVEVAAARAVAVVAVVVVVAVLRLLVGVVPLLRHRPPLRPQPPPLRALPWVVVLDAGFMSVRTALAFFMHGLYIIGNVKTAHAYMVKEWLLSQVPNRGDRATATTTISVAGQEVSLLAAADMDKQPMVLLGTAGTSS